MRGSAVTIVLADDSARLRQLVRRTLAPLEEFRVVGEAADGSTALQLVVALIPDLLLLDLSMPKRDGLHVLAELAKRRLPTRVIVHTAHAAGSTLALRARELGAVEVVEKDAGPAVLCERLRASVRPPTW
jgi:DNA-binding NarL/FixJ family response regulator